MSPSKSTMLLEHHLKQLKLPTMLREYPSLAAACTSDRSDYPTYLLRLCERELLDREQRAAERRIKAARFPVLKTLEQFEFTWPTKINRLAIQNLFRLKFIEDKANAILIGGVGLGKTHLAIALGWAACQAGTRVRFATAIDIINGLSAAQNAGRLVKELKQYIRPELLIIDELGCASRSAKTPCRVRDPTRSCRSGSEKLRAGEASAWTLNREAALTT